MVEYHLKALVFLYYFIKSTLYRISYLSTGTSWNATDGFLFQVDFRLVDLVVKVYKQTQEGKDMSTL